MRTLFLIALFSIQTSHAQINTGGGGGLKPTTIVKTPDGAYAKFSKVKSLVFEFTKELMKNEKRCAQIGTSGKTNSDFMETYLNLSYFKAINNQKLTCDKDKKYFPCIIKGKPKEIFAKLEKNPEFKIYIQETYKNIKPEDIDALIKFYKNLGNKD